MEISIVMPCFDAELHLRKSLTELSRQSYEGWKLIAVDDGSRDGTLDILRANRDTRVEVVAQRNMGVSIARNVGLGLAEGRFVAFLDADDTWAPRFLERMRAALVKRPDAVLAYCGWQNVGLAGGRGAPFIPPDYETPHKSLTLLEGCRWPIHACLVRRAAVEAVGGFDERLKVGEDHLLWMEVARQGRIIRVPEVLAYYHHHGGPQATKDRSRAALDTFRAKQIFLERHPEVVDELGEARVEELTWGRLLEDANALYWRGDIKSARPLFRKLLAAGRGGMRDRLRMVSSLLPTSFHRRMHFIRSR